MGEVTDNTVSKLLALDAKLAKLAKKAELAPIAYYGLARAGQRIYIYEVVIEPGADYEDRRTNLVGDFDEKNYSTAMATFVLAVERLVYARWPHLKLAGGLLHSQLEKKYNKLLEETSKDETVPHKFILMTLGPLVM